MDIWGFLTVVADGLTVFAFGVLLTIWVDRWLIKRENELRLPWEKEDRKKAERAKREAEKARKEWWYGPTVRERELAQESERQKALRKAKKRKKTGKVFE